jgi:hypothetical protein
MNWDGQDRMQQAIEPMMHRKILLRAAELVAMGWTTGPARGAQVTRGSAAPTRQRSPGASPAPCSAHCSRSSASMAMRAVRPPSSTR